MRNEIEEEQVAVVVTTAHRGVFFGYLAAVPDLADNAKSVRLANARMCVHWDSATHGVVGLAVRGPLSGCNVSPAALEITLADVTAIMRCTPEAAAAWEAEPWG